MDWRLLGITSVIIVDIVGYSMAGLAMGYLIWRKLGAPWWILLLTSSLGLTLGMFRVYRLMKREAK